MHKAFKILSRPGPVRRPTIIAGWNVTGKRERLELKRFAASVRLRRYQPADQLLLELVGKIDPHVGAGIDPQRFGIGTIEQKLNPPLTGRAGK